MSYSLVSKYRTQLMGFAVLWIALLHASMYFPIEIINWIKLIGQGGVDIFLFLSSFGLYYAYQKEKRPMPFILRRLLRILPYYIPIALCRCIYLDYSIQETILMLTTLSFWLSWDRSYWYVSGILVLYCFTPFFLNLIKRNFEKAILISIVISFVVSLFFLPTRWSVFTSRIPVFLLGFLFGKYSYEKKDITRKMRFYLLISFFSGLLILRGAFLYLNEDLLWSSGLYWYPFILIVAPLCVYLSRGLFYLESKKFTFLVNELKKIGTISFEFYLLHEVLLTAFTVIIVINPMYNAYGYMLNIIVILITYAISYYYHYVVKFVISLFEQIIKAFRKKKVEHV